MERSQGVGVVKAVQAEALFVLEIKLVHLSGTGHDNDRGQRQAGMTAAGNGQGQWQETMAGSNGRGQ